MKIILAHPDNFLDSLKIDIILKIRYRRCNKSTLQLWMFFLNYIQNVLDRKPMRRSDNDAFPVLVGLAVQSSIAKVDVWMSIRLLPDSTFCKRL